MVADDGTFSTANHMDGENIKEEYAFVTWIQSDVSRAYAWNTGIALPVIRVKGARVSMV
jgi:hypothetical protein